MKDHGDGDARLVERARRGDAGAREALVRRYLRPAYAVALAIARNVADAEDLAQDSLVAALDRIDQCREPERFAAWLFQGVRNRALNQAEQRRNRAALADAVPRGEAAEPRARDVVLRLRLVAALERLTPAQREVVLLHDLESWTHGEIAGALGISEVMSRQHLFVARRAMREWLGDEGATGRGPAEVSDGRSAN
ncbi:MAG TPA: sigma-70 family RNA polymerase sigma factor [Anaeromyxobacteraceae bacterium]|nr:sigma-70 family RNA polymerase sigma factor [Anaeromyxobacteraceae bacterium]